MGVAVGHSVVIRLVFYDHRCEVPVSLAQLASAAGTLDPLSASGANRYPFIIQPAALLGLPAMLGF